MKLVIAAVNFSEGGPLAVLRGIVKAAAEEFPEWDIYVLVHRLGTVDQPRTTEIAFPHAKTSWLQRLKCEWVEFKELSERLRPDVWLSLHDITPRVVAGRQYVYCHNPAPFCTAKIPCVRMDRKFILFRSFYGLLYRCFIRRNAAVIVQQEWLRSIFKSRLGARRVIVAHPKGPTFSVSHRPARNPSVFFYPAFPRVFKNFELLGECAAILDKDERWAGRIVLTIDGSENQYAQEMLRRFQHSRSLQFIGLQPPQAIEQLYREADAVIFPSLLETWGLPLTEAKSHGLPILAADLPYARETVGDWDQTAFFDPYDAASLASLMLQLHLGDSRFTSVSRPDPAPEFAEGWAALLNILLVQDQPAPDSPRAHEVGGSWTQNP
jgi:glycosyltransferase involved in cell wall biosynthesis